MQPANCEAPSWQSRIAKNPAADARREQPAHFAERRDVRAEQMTTELVSSQTAHWGDTRWRVLVSMSRLWIHRL